MLQRVRAAGVWYFQAGMISAGALPLGSYCIEGGGHRVHLIRLLL